MELGNLLHHLSGQEKRGLCHSADQGLVVGRGGIALDARVHLGAVFLIDAGVRNEERHVLVRQRQIALDLAQHVVDVFVGVSSFSVQ